MKRPKIGEPDYSTRIWEYIEFTHRRVAMLTAVSCVISTVTILLVVIRQLAG